MPIDSDDIDAELVVSIAATSATGWAAQTAPLSTRRTRRRPTFGARTGTVDEYRRRSTKRARRRAARERDEGASGRPSACMSVRRPRPDVCQGDRLDQNLKNTPESRDGDVKFSVAAHADGARPFDRSTVMAPSRVSRAGHDASGARRRRRASPTERPVTPTHPGEAKLLVEEYDGTELDYVFLGHPRDAFDDTLASVERIGVRPRRRAGLGSVARALRAAFLPEGYPDSVTPDYAPFQFWDTCQALCSYVRGSLTTRALLEGVGVGTVGASSASATAQFVLRDMTGMLGGVLFAARVGSGLDEHAKQWRFFADCVTTSGWHSNSPRRSSTKARSSRSRASDLSRGRCADARRGDARGVDAALRRERQRRRLAAKERRRRRRRPSSGWRWDSR